METTKGPGTGQQASMPSSIPGSVALILREKAYELRIPRLFGDYELLSERPLSFGRDLSETVPETFLPPFNVLDSLVGLPLEVREELTEEECQRVLGKFRAAQSVFQRLEMAHGLPWIREARTDLGEATSRLLGLDPDYGESRWLSLLAATRALKAFLVSRGRRGFHTHQLIELAEEAENQGLVQIPMAWVSAVQCEESIREAGEHVILGEAVRAFDSAFRIVGHAVAGIRPVGE
ncbi:hypothetical protein ACFL3S_00775 [Gemmatimonadota bacterium]